MDPLTFCDYQRIILANNYQLFDFEYSEMHCSYTGPSPHADLPKTDVKKVITLKHRRTGKKKDYEIGDQIYPLSGSMSWLDQFEIDLIAGFFDDGKKRHKPHHRKIRYPKIQKR